MKYATYRPVKSVSRNRCFNGLAGGAITDPASSATAASSPASAVHHTTGFTCRYRYVNVFPPSSESHQYGTERAPTGHIQNGLAFSSVRQKSIWGRAESYQRA